MKVCPKCGSPSRCDKERSDHPGIVCCTKCDWHGTDLDLVERRVPMQGDGPYFLPEAHTARVGKDCKPPGTITWEEHLVIYALYAKRYPGSAHGQSAERLAERGGFSFYEAVDLGHEPKTWEPR